MATNLARIEKVELRKAWPHEATHFTPWLADNLTELGDALEVELELQETESGVGTRSLDILAMDRDGRPVIIENQLGYTDNDHLSRLLIYAAGKDAKLVIWVSGGIDDEHRQVLDWLNQRTDENVQFFGVIVELWRIEDSKPAPYFRVAAAPNDWRKQNVSRTPRDPGLKQRNRSFRDKLEERLRERGHFVSSKAHSGSWCVLQRIPRLGHFSVDFASDLRVNLWIDKSTPEQNELILQRLREDEAIIEGKLVDSSLGERGHWTPQGAGKKCRMSVHRSDSIHKNQDSWDEYQEWMINKFFLFKEVFEPRLQELPIAETEGDTPTEGSEEE